MRLVRRRGSERARCLRCNRNIMIKSVLVSVDGSRAAENAVSVALDLASPLSASIKALMVVDSKLIESPIEAARKAGAPGVPSWASDLQGGLEAHARRVLEDVSSRCRARQVLSSAVLRVGWPQGEIVEQCAGCDLVVLGRRSVLHEGTADGPGAVATYVFRRSRTPRLFIDERTPLPKRIWAGFDGSADGQHALEVASEIARATRYPLTVFHANPEEQSGGELEAAAALLAKAPVPNTDLVEVGATPLTACREQFAKSPDTLFVLGAGGRNRLSDWLLGTRTESIYYGLRATLLVCGPSS